MSSPKPSMAKSKDPIAAELGRRGGMKGGKARAAALSPEQRREIARLAATTRWVRMRAETGQPESAAAAGAANLPGSERIARSGTIPVGSHLLQWFELEDQRRLIGILSAAAALGDMSPVALEQAIAGEQDGAAIVNLHQQQEWQLVRGVEVDSFVAYCTKLARGLWQGPALRGQSRVRAVAAAELLVSFVEPGLRQRIGETSRPV